MSLVPNNTSRHLLNINTGSKYFAMFVSFLKHAPLKLILYLFMNQILDNLCLFPRRQPFTTLSAICVPLNCEAEMFINYAP